MDIPGPGANLEALSDDKLLQAMSKYKTYTRWSELGLRCLLALRLRYGRFGLSDFIKVLSCPLFLLY